MVHLLLLFSLVKKVDGPGFDYQVTLQLILGSRHDGLSLWEAHWVVQHGWSARAEQLGELGLPGCDEALSGMGGASLINEAPGVM